MTDPLRYILRYRTSRGFGVHSPLAYRLITEVINGREDYYDYEEIDRLASCRRERERLRMLYRIAVRFVDREWYYMDGVNDDSPVHRVLKLLRKDMIYTAHFHGIRPGAFVVFNRAKVVQLPEEGVFYYHTGEYVPRGMTFSSRGATLTVRRHNLPCQHFRLL